MMPRTNEEPDFGQKIGGFCACVVPLTESCRQAAQSGPIQNEGSTVFRQLICISTAMMTLVAGQAEAEPSAYEIESAHTVVSFEVSSLGIARRRGLFDGVTGTVHLDPQASSGSMNIVVNARTVETSDTATKAFLRGKSFLNVDRYAEIVYEADRVVFDKDRPVRIEGELTLLGVTRSVSGEPTA